jgi:hypothetical protein
MSCIGWVMRPDGQPSRRLFAAAVVAPQHVAALSSLHAETGNFKPFS